ncbi:hypothetical protein BDV12DRAFT_207413 [Aspergillus spectabilis]
MNLNLLRFPRKSTPQPQRQETSLYALDHALLNIPLPPPSMWMNMGYWKDTADFPTACASLLDQILITASLLGPDGEAIHHPKKKTFRVLDVGIGCGDQSLRVCGYTRISQGNLFSAQDNDESKGGEEEEEEEPLFESYTGLTSLPVQASFASSRLSQSQKIKASEGKRQTKAAIFCADAADPSFWSEEIHSCLPSPSPGSSSSSKDSQTKETEEEEENWLLALDTLYHFTPSRAPLLHYTSSTLHASLMAFDLLLPSPPHSLSLIQKILLYFLCLITSTPYSNFLTQKEYTSLLIEAGYDPEKIIFRDISEHVFPGISYFIKKREGVLKRYGMRIGKFKGAGRVFGWWGSGVLRGVIVVARR